MNSRGVRRGARRRRRRAIRQILIFIALIIVAVIAIYASRVVEREAERYDISKHPLRYEEVIAENARAFGLEPAHVAAVILCESSFRAEAVSYAGALGLMQVMPDTGAWIAGKLGEADGYEAEGLTDPGRNIRYGCWYLRFLLDRFGGDLRLATAAYHAGQGTVDRWLADPENSEDGVRLDRIPSAETSRYVGRVTEAYEAYARLYSFDRF